MNIAIKKYPDRSKHCIVLEQGNQGLIIGTIRNEEMLNVLYSVFGKNTSLWIDDDRSIDELLDNKENND